MPKLYAYPQAGLGNRLFILASMMGYAHKVGREFSIIGYDFNRHIKYPWLMSQCGLDEFRQMDTAHVEKICGEQNIQVIWDDRHTDLSCREFNLDPTRDTCLIGYFINENYFKDIAPRVREAFREPAHVKEYLDTYFQHPQFDLTKTVAIHVRIGDYKHSPNHQIPLHRYYEQALLLAKQRFGQDVAFLIIGEDEQETRLFYPHLFKETNVHLFQSSKTQPEIDLYAMTRTAGVICANSTFSWWGAWLNPRSDKWTTIPSRWLRDREEIPTMEGAMVVSV